MTNFDPRKDPKTSHWLQASDDKAGPLPDQPSAYDTAQRTEGSIPTPVGMQTTNTTREHNVIFEIKNTYIFWSV